MKSIIKSIAFIGLMCIGTTSWAIPFTSGFTLYGSTDNGNTLCLLGCTGQLTAETTTSQITDLDVTIDTGNGALPQLNFGNPILPGVSLGTVTFIDDMIKTITTSLSSGTNNHLLTITGNEWGIGENFLTGGVTDGPLITGGGSQVTVPEPGVIALLGIGLAVMGLRRRRKSSTI